MSALDPDRSFTKIIPKPVAAIQCATFGLLDWILRRLAQSPQTTNRIAIMRRLFITVAEIAMTKGRRCATYVRFQ